MKFPTRDDVFRIKFILFHNRCLRRQYYKDYEYCLHTHTLTTYLIKKKFNFFWNDLKKNIYLQVDCYSKFVQFLFNFLFFPYCHIKLNRIQFTEVCAYMTSCEHHKYRNSLTNLTLKWYLYWNKIIKSK